MVLAPEPPSTNRTVLVVQHVEVEGLGLLGELFTERRIGTTWVGPSDSIAATALEGVDGLVVLGGPMGVYETDRHPRLRDEMRLLTDAIARDVPVLGICLGSQLLAAALGARVYPGKQKEIGWLDVALEPAAAGDLLFQSVPTQFRALHWHGDVFDLPSGATHLASSELTTHQAFSYEGKAWGLLFHLEAGSAEVRTMADTFAEEVTAAGVDPADLLASTFTHAAGAREIARSVFGGWIQLVERERTAALTT